MRSVTPETRIGGAAITVRKAAMMGRFPLEALVETVELMLRQRVVRWVRAENRVVAAPRLVK